MSVVFPEFPSEIKPRKSRLGGWVICQPNHLMMNATRLWWSTSDGEGRIRSR